MKAKINFDGNWLSEVDINSYPYPSGIRLKRSLKIFFIFFGCALFSVLIPVLHFILVPVFLFLSVFLPYRKFNELQFIDLKNFTCPVCATSFNAGEIGLKNSDTSVRLYCYECRKSLTIVVE